LESHAKQDGVYRFLIGPTMAICFDNGEGKDFFFTFIGYSYQDVFLGGAEE